MAEKPMDIKVGEGLQESRLNTELIEWLQKYSHYILFILAGVALWYWYSNKVEQDRAAAMDAAYVAYTNALETHNPDSLLDVASTHQGKGAVEYLARLKAADVYLTCATYRLTPAGLAAVRSDPASAGVFNDSDFATDEQVQSYLDKAAIQYDLVANETVDSFDDTMVHLIAMFGQAAVAESNAELDRARTLYESIAAQAEQAAFDAYATIASERLASLDTVGDSPTLFAASDLYQPPQANLPTNPATDEPFTFPDGTSIDSTGTPTFPSPGPLTIPTPGQPSPDQ